MSVKCPDSPESSGQPVDQRFGQSGRARTSGSRMAINMKLENLQMNDNWLFVKYDSPSIFVDCSCGVVLSCKMDWSRVPLKNQPLQTFKVGDRVVFPDDCKKYCTEDKQLMIIHGNDILFKLWSPDRDPGYQPNNSVHCCHAFLIRPFCGWSRYSGGYLGHTFNSLIKKAIIFYDLKILGHFILHNKLAQILSKHFNVAKYF